MLAGDTLKAVRPERVMEACLNDSREMHLPDASVQRICNCMVIVSVRNELSSSPESATTVCSVRRPSVKWSMINRSVRSTRKVVLPAYSAFNESSAG